MEKRSANDVLKLVKDEGVEIVDVRFCDLPGLMQHFSVPAHELTADVFDDGLGFDGSSIRGFQEIQESDMLLIPDPNTAVLDPFRQHTTLNINAHVRDPLTGESYEPVITACEALAKKAIEHVENYGFGVEARLSGLHETAPWNEFSYGVSDRGASVRIPWQVEVDGKGYIEDRRPNANMDPYVVTRLITDTVCSALGE